MARPSPKANRPVLYELEYGPNSLYIRSSEIAIAIYKEWVAQAISRKATCKLTLYALLSPTTSRVHTTTHIALLLNGGWESAKMQHYTIEDGEVLDVYIGKRAYRYEYGHYKYRKTRRMNKDFAEVFSLFCSDKSLVESCIRSPNYGIFYGALTLENQTDEMQRIKKYSRQLYNLCNRAGKYIESKASLPVRMR
jgi:hypothetical protein